MPQIVLNEKPFLDCQSLPKGIDACACMLLHRMHLVLPFNKEMHIYSLKAMMTGKPALSSVISLAEMFQNVKIQEYMDEITAVFQKKGEEFGKAVFQADGSTTKSNLLLKADKVKERIRFLGSSEMKVKKMQTVGDGLLVILCDGRATFIQDIFSKSKIPISLTSFGLSKVITATSLSPTVILLVMADKIAIYSLSDSLSKPIIAHKWNESWRIADVYGWSQQKDKWSAVAVGPDRILRFQINKKKIIMLDQFKCEQFISNAFFYRNKLFACTANSIYQHLYTQISNPAELYTSKDPISVLHVDTFGTFVLGSLFPTSEHFHLVTQSPSGIYVVVTAGKNGSYKEGRIGIFETGWEGIMKAVADQIVSGEEIDSEDIGLLSEWKGRKEKLQQISLLPKNIISTDQLITIEGIPLTPKEVNIFLLHLLRPFLPNTNHLLMKTMQKLNEFQRNTCMFTGKKIGEEAAVQCKGCGRYGLLGKGSKCPICRGKIFQV